MARISDGQDTRQSGARRTALVLAAAQAVIGSAPPVCISVGALVGYQLLDADKSLATAPVTGFNLGVALGAIPAAAIVRLMGYRGGFLLGAGLTGIAGLIATFGLLHASFWTFVLGLAAVGLGGAFVQQYRFAAADSAAPGFKARAISWVMAGGIVNGILGPQIVIFSDDLLAPVKFAGCFALIIVLAAAGALILSFLPAAARGRDDTDDTKAGDARPLLEIARQPQFVVALLCAVGSYALMSFVMTGAPLAMVGCGFTTDQAALGISWHVLAMFGPSFFTGMLITRFGKERIVAAGLLLLVGCGICALAGLELWNFWLALILLGLGWNFGFIGATTMVTSTYRPSEKSKVQGVHDFLLFGSVAMASLMSGIVYNAGGWTGLNLAIFPVTGICLTGLLLLAIAARRSGSVRPAE